MTRTKGKVPTALRFAKFERAIRENRNANEGRTGLEVRRVPRTETVGSLGFVKGKRLSFWRMRGKGEGSMIRNVFV